MGWSIGYDNNWKRHVGYGVPAMCDQPECNTEIDRGLAFVCGGQQMYGGENGCGLHFCGEHKSYHRFRYGDKGEYCKRCIAHKPSYRPKPDIPEWIKWKLTDKSWKEWRKKNPEEVKEMKLILQRPPSQEMRDKE